ncbi:MAG TPA: hypothetical protein VD973_20225 [Symbiobacteriaceae bacterium]|jgi:hypothetical protein|nr:hypothetical protein [Symbiobacteriaceae bacterium]
MSKKKPVNRRGNQGLWWVVGGAVVLVGALIAFNQFGGKKDSVVKTDTELNAVRNVIGSSAAKVTLTKYSDFL